MTDEEFEELMAEVARQQPPELTVEGASAAAVEVLTTQSGYRATLNQVLAAEERRTFLTEQIRRLEVELAAVNEHIDTIYGTVKTGSIVEVVGKALGTVGTVFWMGPGYRGEGIRVGITDEFSRTFWAPEKSVRPVRSLDPEQKKRLKEGAKLARDAYTVQQALVPKP